MDAIINIQYHLSKSIQKALVNLKKSPKERLTTFYVEKRLSNLEQDWSHFRENNAKLYETFNIDEVEESTYAQNNVYEQTEEDYTQGVAHIQSVLHSLRPVIPIPIESNSSKGSSVHSTSLAKLPKISIPVFSGKYEEWTTFRDLFVSLVHKNTSLDNVQKIHYLKAHLAGEAEQLVRHTPIADSNYERCWELLDNRYNNKRFLSNSILNKLFKQRAISVESASALKELLDVSTDCLSALRCLGIDVSTWDIIVIHIISLKLDPETRKQWELLVSSTDNDNNELPTFAQLQAFMKSRFRALEFIEPSKGPVPRASSSGHQSAPRSFLTTSETTTSSTSVMPCEYCSENHKLTFCKKFTDQDTNIRREFVAKNRMCFNCLGGNHNVYSCRKPTTCRICHRRHHTLLHVSIDSNAKKEVAPNVTVESEARSDVSSSPIVSCLSTGHVAINKQVLLATALIKAEAKSGEYQTVRALLDQGSQACFITEDTAQLLRLKKVPVDGKISGLGNEQTKIKANYIVHTTIRSRTNPQFQMKIKAYVLKSITSYLPERKIEPLNWLELKSLHLADPQYNLPQRIDMLLGADVYGCIMNEGVKKSPTGTLIAQNTSLGWILSGAVVQPMHPETNTTNVTFAFHAQCSENDLLKKFWEIEEQLPSKSMLTEEEQKCEAFFKQTTMRTENGRYVVNLPFRDEAPLCRNGNSRNIAVNRLKSLEKRLAKNKTLKEQYTEVINEYLRLDHMKPVEKSDDKINQAVYLPHHAVVRDDKTTTKVRVVFNASSPNDKGVSLNDTLMVGPTLQADLRHIILRWRVHSIAVVADIVKMYRQVLVADKDAVYQRIVWRDSPDAEIKDYELKTVTFGTSPAPYLAVRAMQQLAYDDGKELPLAAENVLNRFYMDDLMSGCSTVEEGVELYKEMVKLLEGGGFKLQKWNSNKQELLEQINEYENKDQNGKRKDKVEQEEREVDFKLDATIKILGLTWNRNEDHFRYSVQLPTTTSGPVTKRMIISDIARLFDPLGWIAPTVIIAKMLIQKLWLTGIGWDEAVPTDLLNEWDTYRKELPQLTAVRIPRWLGTQSNDTDVELHGFCDASQLAYAAVIYLRVLRPSGEVHTSLLVAKTRVAPIKQVSIPRLELCGAVLLTKLIQEAMEVLSISKEKIKAWTDSTIVLAWLNSHPSRWKTFVANRVSDILTTLDSSQWNHVVSEHNPADCASRGVPPSLLAEMDGWLYGPQFLRDPIIQYKRTRDLNINLEENIKVHVASVPTTTVLERFSSLQRMLRVISYCKRFLNKNKGYIKKAEVEEAWECCVKGTQAEEYTEEIKGLKSKEQIVSKNSHLKSLSPYLDEKGVIRVGGRLHNSNLPEQTKHPVILPHHSHLAKLIVDDAHKNTLHGGVQLMMNYIRTAYWIIGVKSIVKLHIRKCVKCIRQAAAIKTQFMGSLPSVRCTPARAFQHSGVDYAGPIQVRTTKGRGNKSYKGYICLFICMATRAIHLELVSDMSSEAFLAAFRRFVSRRGHCSDIWSDNGTTFVGASKELIDLAKIQEVAAEYCETHGTQWHFIPPRAPNFGGLWEAGVKSTKYHLKRVIGDSTLTFEEMSTLLSQIEACLNSRPIAIVNSDPNEPYPLTPGHFLIGEPLVAVSDRSFLSSSVSLLSRWQTLQKSLQNFWSRWSHDYLGNLLHRYKWSAKIPEPNVGDLVLIKEDDLPPGRWLMGRVVQKHPGQDNVTRVVTPQTSKSVNKRPTSKLCVLPISS